MCCFSSRSENKDDRSVWIRMTEIYIRLPLRKEFDQTWQEARAQCLLQVSLCFSDQSAKKRWPPLSLIGWGIFNFSSSIARGTEFDETWHSWSKYSMSSTKFLGFFFFCGFFWGGGVLTGLRGKQICTSCQLYGMPYLLWFPNNLCGSLQGFALFHIRVL